jgi:hypothetical protein
MGLKDLRGPLTVAALIIGLGAAIYPIAVDPVVQKGTGSDASRQTTTPGFKKGSHWKGLDEAAKARRQD